MSPAVFLVPSTLNTVRGKGSLVRGKPFESAQALSINIPLAPESRRALQGWTLLLPLADSPISINISFFTLRFLTIILSGIWLGISTVGLGMGVGPLVSFR